MLLHDNKHYCEHSPAALVPSGLEIYQMQGWLVSWLVCQQPFQLWKPSSASRRLPRYASLTKHLWSLAPAKACCCIVRSSAAPLHLLSPDRLQVVHKLVTACRWGCRVAPEHGTLPGNLSLSWVSVCLAMKALKYTSLPASSSAITQGFDPEQVTAAWSVVSAG